MPKESPIDRIRGAWMSKAAGAREQALLALLVTTAAAGAHLARLGTAPARAATAALILGVLVWQVALSVSRRRFQRSPRRTLEGVLLTTDAALGERALRALTLVERSAKDESVGSSELAELHFDRLLARASTENVSAAATRHSIRYRGIALGLLSIALVLVVVRPAEIVEGLDVLVARHGKAPLPMTWLRYPRVTALPPTYTREGERSLVFGTAVALPKGTVITVRGVSVEPDRRLVLVGGTREEPFASDGAGGVVARHVVESTAPLSVAARFGNVLIEEEEQIFVSRIVDGPPKVQVEGAPRTVKLVDAERIDLRWAASDDYGLREVDLVLRSGAREERRVLARFDGETKQEHGGHVLTPRDAFLRRMYLPVTVTVEAKDNDPLDGPKWTASAPIVLIPPEVGEPEAVRYAALRALRDRAVDVLAWRAGALLVPAAERVQEGRSRILDFTSHAGALLAASYAGAPVPAGLGAFVRGLVDRLGKIRGDVSEGAIEEVALALDVALAAFGNRDAAEVAKRLADVAEEVAVAARIAREPEKNKDGFARLDVGLVALERGAAHLATLSVLGRDVGSVAAADAGRVRRSRGADDLTHTELAALHMAARLRRPMPSFGATTGSGKRGVESGHGRGRGEGGMPPPSEADREFDERAGAVSGLAREHEGALRGVESALDEAGRAAASSRDLDLAKRHAEAVREAAKALPLPGQEFGTPRAAAALAREHATASAHALDDQSLDEAVASAENALGALGQAEKRLDLDDPVRDGFGELRKALGAARDWAKAELERQRRDAEERARSALRQAADTERDLGARAEKLSRERGDRAGGLPDEMADKLERAASAMQEAARELAEGRGERALALQREAQRLLEQSRLGKTTDEAPEEGPEHAERPPGDPGEHLGQGGHDTAFGGEVPGPDPAARAEEFRRRVLEGLARDKSERLSPAVRRYAEGLLR